MEWTCAMTSQRSAQKSTARCRLHRRLISPGSSRVSRELLRIRVSAGSGLDRRLLQLLSQRLPQDLAHVGLGQLLPEINVPRGLVRREGLAAEVDDGALRERGILAYHEQRHDLARVLISLRNRGGLENPGVAGCDRL